MAIFCVRVDLDDARPSIWRRLDLRSEVTLDVLHQVLQAAFSWDDYHLHRFSLGGRPFDRVSQVFLCPYDADNPEFEDGDGPEASQVRLDQTLHDLGDKLHYLYDYGDNWELTLHLEQVMTALDGYPTAVLVDGRRADQPGGMRAGAGRVATPHLSGPWPQTWTIARPATPSRTSKSPSCVTTGSCLAAAIAAIHRSLMRTRRPASAKWTRSNAES